ncbi:MAG TPA: DUF11 domain-containing protein, partial [Blastocatellia bacterium]|nr:DUF11 domain-containing protein [Blastocatellia bacterium]
FAIKTGPATVGPNGSVVYKVIVGNSGPAGVTNAPFSDNVPSVLTNVSWTCGSATGGASCGTSSGSGNAISTNVASLPAGSSVTFTITATAPSSGSFSNSAVITTPVGVVDSDPTDNIGGPVITNILVVGDLAITKTDGSATYTPGGSTTYTIVVTNNGPDAITNATVADTLPAAVTSATWTCAASAGSSCGAASGTGNIATTVSLLANGTATYTLTAQISPAATGNLVNTATVTNPPGTTDPTPGNNSATDTDTANPLTDLAITKTDGSATYTAGTAISYTIVVTNNGPSNATGVSVADTVPASITGTTITCVASGAAVCGTNASSGNALSFTGINIPVGAANFLTITVSGTVNPATTGNLVNTATVTAGPGQTDPTPGNNSATDTDTSNNQTDLAITKTDGSATYTAGTAITYTIRVSNNGPSNATGVTVTDAVPASITGTTIGCVASGAASCGTNASAGNNLSFTGVSIPVGAANFLTITVSGTVSPATTGSLVNTATVTAGPQQTDPTTGNNSATDTDTPDPRADLSVTKTDGSATYVPGRTTTYTIVVRNNGPSNVTGALVTDPKPAQISSWTWTCLSSTGGAGGCDGVTNSSANFSDSVNLPAGATITYSVTANTLPGATGNLVNTVTVDAPAGVTDPNTSNNSATDTDTAAPLADLSLTKTVSNSVVDIGQQVTFTITVSNAGPSTATGVVVSDPLPAGLAFVSATPSQGSYSSATGLWTVGTIAPNGTATLQMIVTVNDPSVANIAEISASDVTDPDSTPGNGVPTEDDYGKVVFGSSKGPGLPISPRAEAADDKAGSVLVYNYYTSSASNPTLQNTRIAITNTNPKMDIYVHLFFVDGTSCSVADNFICLTPNQTSFFLASDLDPGVSGYLIAVAVDANGCPINANCLIGDEYIKLESGHAGNIAAVSISAISATPAACNNSSSTAELKFDGNSYNRLPTLLALDNIPSRSDANDTLLVINRIGGNLGIGAGTLGTLFGILYDDTERAFSFSVSGNCQIRSSLSNNFPRTAPRFETAIPAGRSGWLKLWSAANNGILGAAINFNPNKAGSSNAYGGARNLNHLRLTDTASYIMPVFPPSCR